MSKRLHVHLYGDSRYILDILVHLVVPAIQLCLLTTIHRHKLVIAVVADLSISCKQQKKQTRKPSYRWQTRATQKHAKIVPIRRAYNVVADNTGLSSFV